jgi:hypothetical protein
LLLSLPYNRPRDPTCDEPKKFAPLHCCPFDLTSVEVYYLKSGSSSIDVMLADVRFGSKADMCGATRGVRFGSKADIRTAKSHVHFTPEREHLECSSGCPLWAKSGHGALYSITSPAMEIIPDGTSMPSTRAF